MRKFNCVTVKCLSTKQTHTTPCPIHICIFEGESVMLPWGGSAISGKNDAGSRDDVILAWKMLRTRHYLKCL
jgi:hypothetical protein